MEGSLHESEHRKDLLDTLMTWVRLKGLGVD